MLLKDRLNKAVEIAEEAGRRIIEARQNSNFGQRYKDGSELVTDVDVAVDTYISGALDQYFGDEARLSEELMPDKDAITDSRALWIIDPIDGTVNFAHGQRHVAVSIAWAEKGKVQIGVVHAPFLGETFTAIRDEGAWCNNEAIAPRECKHIAEALVGTGFPYDRDARLPLLRRLRAVLENCRDVRRNGSAALDLCDVACGRLDAYYESTSPWDFAAGLLIAREAGARTGHLYPCPEGIPKELYGENLVTSAPAIYSELASLLEKADRNIFDYEL
ncbi:inositol monophosphatase family protein [Larsenimonas rhizosphaerae]|uniref:Inositol-1-monophosphatase n=1 Tax=Larsenimonas rhizosphaerae TaxID=2944682 RepID=A0AA41ZF59_9GAMM|nr:inositol monophosphatase family protein [Larsenimonas rhizosphaerae]MCM2130716.1 inositol monophosphatase [Larsenimonas rhizosphaerae]MCX2523420.1 inositol monophosphatase [Larsenimonas rhizosphaerae]